MYDSLDELFASATSTSTATGTGAWKDYLTQPATGDDGLSAVFHITGHTAVTPGPNVVFSVQWSADGTNLGGTLWSGPAVTPGVTPSNILGGVGYFEQVGPFIAPATCQYIRVIATFSATTGTPSITWDAQLQYGGRNG